jgi:hypothetical protein
MKKATPHRNSLSRIFSFQYKWILFLILICLFFSLSSLPKHKLASGSCIKSVSNNTDQYIKQ